jgi:L-fuculose-phosphate aldolase
MMDEKEIRQAVKEAGVRLVSSGLVQGTWGNISIRLDEKHMVVTPSGLDYIRLKPEDMVVVDIDTLEYDGPLKPTSEKKIHAAIYRNRKDVHAVIHSHPVHCSSVAAARRELPVMTQEMQQYVGGPARVGRYGLPGTKKLTDSTVEALGDRNGCLMANHGVLVCAASIERAFEVCRVMEECSRLFIESEAARILNRKDQTAGNIREAFCRLIK